MRAALAAALLVAAPASARAAPLAFVACAPGYPGTTAEAQPAMDAFTAAVASGAGLAPGAIAGAYLPGEQDGLARLEQPDAAVALVPLPFLVKHGRALKLTPRLQAVTEGAAGPTEVWSLVAKKGRVSTPAALAGFTLSSTAGYAPAFVEGALAGWGKLPAGVKIVASSQVLSALRRAVSGEDVAVLLDGAQAAALATLPFAGDLEVVARSAPLPSGIVATVGTRLPAARWQPLEKALLGLPSTPQGPAALAGIRLARLAALDEAARAALKRLGAMP